MSDHDPPRMDVAEFRALGYLQELNRGFLHPLGLALETVLHEDGTESLGGIWDYRDDPEGITFGPDHDLIEKARFVAEERERRRPAREEALGYWQQPVESTDPPQYTIVAYQSKEGCTSVKCRRLDVSDPESPCIGWHCGVCHEPSSQYGHRECTEAEDVGSVDDD